jgi:hypothetical protein
MSKVEVSGKESRWREDTSYKNENHYKKKKKYSTIRGSRDIIIFLESTVQIRLSEIIQTFWEGSRTSNVPVTGKRNDFKY